MKDKEIRELLKKINHWPWFSNESVNDKGVECFDIVSEEKGGYTFFAEVYGEREAELISKAPAIINDLLDRIKELEKSQKFLHGERMDALKQADRVSWVSVETRLPKLYQRVHFYSTSHGHCIGFLSNGTGAIDWVDDNSACVITEVTHWQIIETPTEVIEVTETISGSLDDFETALESMEEDIK